MNTTSSDLSQLLETGLATRPKVSTFQEMDQVRDEIDALDGILVPLLARRCACIAEAARIKARDGLPANIPARVEDVIAKVRGHAVTAGFDPVRIEAIWRFMIDQSIAFEDDAMRADTNNTSGDEL